MFVMEMFPVDSSTAQRINAHNQNARDAFIDGIVSLALLGQILKIRRMKKPTELAITKVGKLIRAFELENGQEVVMIAPTGRSTATTATTWVSAL